MPFFEFVIAVVFIVTVGDIIKRAVTRDRSRPWSKHSKRLPKDERKELMDRIERLERLTGNDIEERVANIEKTISDRDFALNEEIRKALEGPDKKQNT